MATYAYQEAPMSTQDEGWSYPQSFGKHLLRGHPSGRMWNGPRDRSHVRGNLAMHAVTRTAGGKIAHVDFTEKFERQLERVVEDMVARQVSSTGLDPRDIEAAIAEVERQNPQAVKVLRWYQKPPKLRHPRDVQGLAFEIGELEREVYRLKEVAILGVWLALPIHTRLALEAVDEGEGEA